MDISYKRPAMSFISDMVNKKQEIAKMLRSQVMHADHTDYVSECLEMQKSGQFVCHVDERVDPIYCAHEDQYIDRAVDCSWAALQNGTTGIYANEHIDRDY